MVELIGRGVGIFASHLELLEALDKCGAGIIDIGVTLYKRIALDRTGGVAAEKSLLQIVTSWDRLRHLLLKAIDRQRYHFGYVFDRVEQEGNGVRVYFANGRVERGDILLGCDGLIRSTVREYSRRTYSLNMLDITSGVAHRTKVSFRRKRIKVYFRTTPYSSMNSFKFLGIRSLAMMKICGRASAL